MASEIKNRRSGVLISDEFVDILCDGFTPQEVGTILLAVFNAVKDRPVNVDGYSREIRNNIKALTASVNRLRSQSDINAENGAKGGRNRGKHSDGISGANSDGISGEDNPSNHPSNQPTNHPSNQPDISVLSADKLAKRNELFPVGGDT